MNVSLGTMVLFPAAAVAAPLLARAVGRWFVIPLVVFEIVLGLVLGPAVLGWIVPDDFTDLLASFGLAMLFFLAGHEIDFRAVRGRPLRLASIGWIISIAAGIGAAFLFAGAPAEAVFIGIALSSTALGTILPMLRDAGELGTPFGTGATAVGAIGEFAPLLAISVFLSGRSPLHASIVLLGFAVVAAIAVFFAARGAGRALHRVIDATIHTSGQFAVRLVILLLLGLVALSLFLGLDMLLGAFTAGVLFRMLLAGAPDAAARLVDAKLDAVGFGFLVPTFFISTGVEFDLAALTADWRVLVLLPVFAVLLLVVRGLPSMLAAPRGSLPRDRAATALLGATGLPIIVAVTAIGVSAGDLAPGTAAALVGAGMLSVLLFPLIALSLRARSRGADAEAAARTREQAAASAHENETEAAAARDEADPGAVAP